MSVLRRLIESSCRVGRVLVWVPIDGDGDGRSQWLACERFCVLLFVSLLLVSFDTGRLIGSSCRVGRLSVRVPMGMVAQL